MFFPVDGMKLCVEELCMTRFKAQSGCLRMSNGIKHLQFLQKQNILKRLHLCFQFQF